MRYEEATALDLIECRTHVVEISFVEIPLSEFPLLNTLRSLEPYGFLLFGHSHITV
jgi:hypothetical protein